MAQVPNDFDGEESSASNVFKNDDYIKETPKMTTNFPGPLGPMKKQKLLIKQLCKVLR